MVKVAVSQNNNNNNSFPLCPTKAAHSLTKLIANFYNLSSYFCLVPFIIKSDPISGQFSLIRRGWVIRKIVIILQFVVLIPEIWPIVLVFFSQVKDFDRIFRTAMTLVRFLCVVNLFLVFWRHEKSLVRTLQLVDSICHSLHSLGVKILSVKRAQILFLTLTVCLFLWRIVDFVCDLGLHKHKVSDAFLRQAILMDHLYYLQPLPSSFVEQEDKGNMTKINQNDPATIELDNYNIMNPSSSRLIRTSILIMAEFLTAYVARLADALVLLHAIVFFLLAHYFAKYLNDSSSLPINSKKTQSIHFQFDLVMKVFDGLSELSTALDETIGSVVFYACSRLLLYNSFKLLSIFQADYLNAFKLCVYALVSGLSLVLAAEANSEIGQFVNWLQWHGSDRKFGGLQLQEQINFQRKLTLAIGQVLRHEVGLKGTCFTITYSFVGNIAGLIVTYSMIIFQLQSVN